jgi:hypothetical protein
MLQNIGNGLGERIRAGVLRVAHWGSVIEAKAMPCPGTR